MTGDFMERHGPLLRWAATHMLEFEWGLDDLPVTRCVCVVMRPELLQEYVVRV